MNQEQLIHRRFKLHLTRNCTVFGAWREAGEVLMVDSPHVAFALVATQRAEVADLRTAEALAQFPTPPSVRAAKRAAGLALRGPL